MLYLSLIIVVLFLIIALQDFYLFSVVYNMEHNFSELVGLLSLSNCCSDPVS